MKDMNVRNTIAGDVGIATALRGWYRYAKYQPLIWLGPGAIYFWIETHQKYPIEWGLKLASMLCWVGTGCLLTAGLAFLYDRTRLAGRPRFWSGLVTIVASMLVAFTWFATYNALDGVLGFTSDYSPLSQRSLKELFHNSFPRTVILVLWHLVGLVRIQSNLTKAERDRSYRLEKLSLEAQIRQLRGHLNPHFLFNSLNSAIALVDENPETSKSMMLSLSELLFETLTSSSKENTTLISEIELIRKYVAIERIRYEEDLLYEEDITKEIPSSLTLPPFLLLPLIENAIKHGMRAGQLPLRIFLTVDIGDGNMLVKVKNTGELRPSYIDNIDREDTGIGVKNMTDRLALELPGRGEFSLEQDGDSVVATLRIRGVIGGTNDE